jgi:hypothetical protein
MGFVILVVVFLVYLILVVVFLVYQACFQPFNHWYAGGRHSSKCLA